MKFFKRTTRRLCGTVKLADSWLRLSLMSLLTFYCSPLCPGFCIIPESAHQLSFIYSKVESGILLSWQNTHCLLVFRGKLMLHTTNISLSLLASVSNKIICHDYLLKLVLTALTTIIKGLKFICFSRTARQNTPTSF